MSEKMDRAVDAVKQECIEKAVDTAKKESIENRQSGTGEQEKRQKLHRFKQGIDMVQPVSNVGDVSVQTIKREVEHSDENYYAGMQETKKYTTPALDAAAIMSAKELAKGIKAELNQITIAGGQVHGLIREGKLSMVDLADKKLLRERLDAIDGLSVFQKHQIGKFREAAYELLVVKDAIEKKQGVADKLEAPLKAHLKSKEFFDLQQEKTNELLKVYFKTSGNDVLRNVNPAGMSEKRLKKLLASGERNGFTASDVAAIRLAGRQMRYRESRIRIGRLLNIRKRVEMLRYYAERMEGVTSEGIKQISTVVQVMHGAFAVGKFGLKAGIVTASFAGKYTGVSYLLHKLNQIRSEKTEQLKKLTKEAVKNSKPYKAVSEKKEAVKEKASDAKNKVNEKLDQYSAVQKYKKVQAKAKEKAKSAAKKANQTKAAARAAGRQVKQGADIVLSPVRFVGKAVSKAGGFFGKMRLALMACAGIIVAVFLMIIVLVNAILSICKTEASAAVSVILTENENFIAEMDSALQAKADEKKADAEKIAKGTPMNPDVLEGHTISKYGHPDGNGDFTGGSKIIYLDGNGNVILNGMNNIKDCIAMAYVIMDGDFDTNTRARDDLIIDLWELMNPAVTYKESDIYTCTGGCDSFSYSCDNASDYATISAYQEDGVGFYGEVKAYSEYGDSYTVTCGGCKDDKGKTFYHSTQTGTGEAESASGCENYTVSYDCDGHSVTVCYGHKDVEVYVTVKMMEEMFASGELPSSNGKSYQSYLSSFAGWTEDNREWVRCLVNTDWYDTYGVDPSGGTGFVAGRGMTPEEISAITEAYGDLDVTRKALCSDAMSFVGMIPYYWGGKASAKDYAANGFHATVTPDEKGRNKKGLDCSGFVQWVIWRVTDVKLGASTGTITEGMEQISASELQPGDLGLMAVPGSASNHVGIFVGYDESGQALWCHENSSAGNVSVNNTTCFRLYYRIF